MKADNNIPPLADEMVRRADAVRTFHEEATGLPHISITIMAHPAYKAPGRDERDRLAQHLVDAAQARAASRGEGRGAFIMKGRLADDPGYRSPSTSFVVVLIAPMRTAIVYLTNEDDDASELANRYKTELG